MLWLMTVKRSCYLYFFQPLCLFLKSVWSSGGLEAIYYEIVKDKLLKIHNKLLDAFLELEMHIMNIFYNTCWIEFKNAKLSIMSFVQVSLPCSALQCIVNACTFRWKLSRLKRWKCFFKLLLPGLISTDSELQKQQTFKSNWRILFSVLFPYILFEWRSNSIAIHFIQHIF